jgi:hypothetical protein
VCASGSARRARIRICSGRRGGGRCGRCTFGEGVWVLRVEEDGEIFLSNWILLSSCLLSSSGILLSNWILLSKSMLSSN